MKTLLLSVAAVHRSDTPIHRLVYWLYVYTPPSQQDGLQHLIYSASPPSNQPVVIYAATCDGQTNAEVCGFVWTRCARSLRCVCVYLSELQLSDQCVTRASTTRLGAQPLTDPRTALWTVCLGSDGIKLFGVWTKTIFRWYLFWQRFCTAATA